MGMCQSKKKEAGKHSAGTLGSRLDIFFCVLILQQLPHPSHSFAYGVSAQVLVSQPAEHELSLLLLWYGPVLLLFVCCLLASAVVLSHHTSPCHVSQTGAIYSCDELLAIIS